MIQKAQHLVFLLQVGGFFCDTLLQPGIDGGKLVGHGVERSAEGRHLVLMPTLGKAVAEITATNRHCQCHQLTPRVQQTAA
ncbi:hypothetical protein D3C75_1167480 [compost metagenome]